jgi:putative transcriptional regulator
MSVSFRHGFLLATSLQQDQPYRESVIYVCEHSSQGAFGLMLNRMLDVTLDALFPERKLILPKTGLYLGGISQPKERGFVLHRDLHAHWGGTSQLFTNLYLTSTYDIFDDLHRYAVKDFRVFVGYCSWIPGQLDEEILADQWLFLPYQDDLIFCDTLSPYAFWTTCYQRLGFSPHQYQVNRTSLTN